MKSMEMNVFFCVFTVALHNCFCYLHSFGKEKGTFWFFSFCARNANPGLLYIQTMSAFIFASQTKQEGILINYFSVLTLTGIWFYSFVFCSVTIIFRNDNKGQRERLEVQWCCFQTELLRKCVWGGCKQHAYLFLQPNAPSSTLPSLTELQVQSHLVAVWERGSHVFVLCNAGEPPGTAGLVISSFTGLKLVLWGVFDTCGICSDAPWS